jgi:hypothetical protein
MTGADIVFQKPWHAQIAAIVHAVTESGTVSAVEWSQTLGAERARQQASGKADATDSYFIAVLDSLLQVLDAKDPTLAADFRATTEAWRSAYLLTAHGHPVELQASVP